MILSKIVYLSVEEAQYAWEIHIAVELYTKSSASKETHMLFIPVKKHPFIVALLYAIIKSKVDSVKIKKNSSGEWAVFRPKTWVMRRTRSVRRYIKTLI